MGENNLPDILKELQVTNLEAIDKYKALQLARLFPKLSESAFQTLFDQVPGFFKLLEEGLIAEKEVIFKAIENNADSRNSLEKMFNIVLETLRDCQKKPNISFEESKYYMDRMCGVLELACRKNTESNAFVERNVQRMLDSNNNKKNWILMMLAGVAGIGLIALGAATNNPFLIQEVTKNATGKVIELIDKKRYTN